MDDNNRPHYSHAEKTIGGLGGHWLRRGFHCSTLLIPIIYYEVLPYYSLNAPLIIIITLLLVAVIELLRLKIGFVVFGQRLHESKYISSFTWGMIGIGIVLLFAPGKEFGFPIIWSYSIGDPLIGELRSRISHWLAFVIGVVAIFSIWLFFHYWLGTPLWIAYFIAPITILVEWPNFKWVDDNLLIQIIPLIIVLLLQTFKILV